MCAAVSLREFIVERLTAAAADIFSACEQTIIRYEEEIDRQRRLLEISSSTDIRQCVPTKGTYYNLDHQRESEPSWIKKELEDSSILHVTEVHGRAQSVEDHELKIEEELETSENKEVALKQETDCIPICETHEQIEFELEIENQLSPNSRADSSQAQSQRELAAPGSPPTGKQKKRRKCQNEEVDVSSGSSSITSESGSVSGSDCFICDICGKAFTLNSQQQQRLNRRMGVNLFVCQICEKQPPKKEGTTSDDADQKLAVCEICDKCFSTTEHVKIHMMSHLKERPHFCNTCGKSFIQLEHLKRHKLIHTGLKPFSCETCGRAFAVQRYLLCHMKTHMVKNLYACEVCGKNFYHLNRFERHLKSHNEERPYICMTCGKSFSLPARLRQHEVIHSGVRPFACEICGKAFALQRYLFRHMKIHTVKKT